MNENGKRLIAMLRRKYPKYILRLCSHRDYIRFLLDRHYTLRFRIANLILGDRLRTCLFLLMFSYCSKDQGLVNVHNVVCRDLDKVFGLDKSYMREHMCLYEDGYDTSDWYGTKFRFTSENN